MTIVWDVYDSPVGPLTIHASPRGLTGLFFPGETAPLDDGARDPGAFADARRQLEEYFAGSRRVFTLPLLPRGTDFQRRVWDELLRIPYGTTVSYSELAARLGNLAATRAVARANATNPLPIVVPCHRVIGADGSLTGYGGGMHRKQTLLALEQTTLF